MRLNNTEILLTEPRGFCAGVERAIEIVNRAVEIFDETIYVKHEVVHNKQVIEKLVEKGVVFVDSLDIVPDGSILIYSAHGVSKEISDSAKKKRLKIFDATCPLVTKVHFEIHKFASQNVDVVLVGHSGHPEVEGTMGRHVNSKNSTIYLVQDEKDARNLQIKNTRDIALVTQTTLSVDETIAIIDILKSRFPNIILPKKDDICYATQNRQDAVKQLALESDYIIVVGSKNSSNSNRLKELAEKCGCKSKLIDEFADLDLEELSSYSNISITAGASAPESRVVEIAKSLEAHIGAKIMEHGEDKENIYFKLPAELR